MISIVIVQNTINFGLYLHQFISFKQLVYLLGLYIFLLRCSISDRLHITIGFLFTALHAMQTRSSDENSVRLSVRPSICLSVCLSVTRVYCDKTVERSVQIYIPYER